MKSHRTVGTENIANFKRHNYLAEYNTALKVCTLTNLALLSCRLLTWF